MRNFAVLCFLGLFISPIINADEPSLINPEAMEERWVQAWTLADENLSEPLQHQRANLLRVTSLYLLQTNGAYSTLLIREEPDSQLSEAASDLTKVFSGVLKELSFTDFLKELGIENKIPSHVRLSLSGVPYDMLKDALRRWLKNFDKKVGVTFLNIKLDELNLRPKASPEFLLIVRDLMKMALQENVLNLRLVISATPDAWNYVWDHDQLFNQFNRLSLNDSLLVVDGSKLEIAMDCAALMEVAH